MLMSAIVAATLSCLWVVSVAGLHQIDALKYGARPAGTLLRFDPAAGRFTLAVTAPLPRNPAAGRTGPMWWPISTSC
jgi:hypothetical protein